MDRQLDASKVWTRFLIAVMGILSKMFSKKLLFGWFGDTLQLRGKIQTLETQMLFACICMLLHRFLARDASCSKNIVNMKALVGT